MLLIEKALFVLLYLIPKAIMVAALIIGAFWLHWAIGLLLYPVWFCLLIQLEAEWTSVLKDPPAAPRKRP
jgi:hypothetical protein